jgi:hypothetical protein
MKRIPPLTRKIPPLTGNVVKNTAAYDIYYGKSALTSQYLNHKILGDNEYHFTLQKDFILKEGTPIQVVKNEDLKYTLVKSTHIRYVNELYNDEQFPRMSIMVVPQGSDLIGQNISTQFNDHVEDKFTIGNGVFLTKGPLGEIYQNKLTKLETLYTIDNNILSPIIESRTVIKVDQKLYKSMNDNGLFNDKKIKGDNGLVIRPSYNPDSVMKVLKYDYIIVHDQNFYRVYGPAFDATYKIQTNSQSAGSNKVRVLGRERNVTKVGRKQMVTYNGKQICLTDARKLEKQLASSKKK